MRAKILKKSIAIICIIALILPISSEVLAKITSTEKDTEQKFGIKDFHTSKYLSGKGEKTFGYKVNDRIAYRIYSGEDNEEGYLNTVLCLDEFGKFPSEESTTDKYKSLGEATTAVLQTLKTTKNGAKVNITQEDAQKIIWLVNNAVLPEDSSELRDVKLSKIFDETIKSTLTNANPLTLDEIKTILTEDDLVFALQAAIWTITNPTTNPTYMGGPNKDSYNSLIGNDVNNSEGRQGTLINIIIDYYRNNYDGKNGNIVKSTADGGVVPKITKPAKKLMFTNDDKLEIEGTMQKGTINDNYMFVGPFKIESSQTGKETVDYSIDIEFSDATGKTYSSSDIRYYLTEGTTLTGGILQQTKAGLEGKEFYVAIKQGTSIRKIDIKLNSASIISDSKPTAWAVEGNENMQPLISPERTENKTEPVSDSYEFEATFKRDYDIALRKFITTIRHQNEEGQWRVENIKDSRAADVLRADPVKLNQYEYNHPKDPIQVEVGDIVTYKLRVYNEGKYNVRITQVIDYLPIGGGIQLLTEDYNGATIAKGQNYVIEENNNKIFINPKTNQTYISELQNIEKTKEFLEITLDFLVTEEAKGRVVTNIAEVTGFLGENDTDGDGNGDGEYVQQEDCDSQINNIKLPKTKKEWEDYKGNSQNKEELSDPNYYYFGQEDDDDFEKIIVPEDYKLDLALRKSITALNGTQTNREKSPDTAPLKNETGTTSNFTDEKDPLVVKAGDKITYTIRVFNEGSKDGYATKICDYIPEGLGFLPNYKDNISNGWKIDGSNSGTPKKLSEITNATQNFSNSDFGNGTEDYKNQSVICGKATIYTEKLKDTKLSKYDKTADKLEIKTVQVTCVVLDTLQPETIIRNIAAITEYADENKEKIQDGFDGTDSHSNNSLENFSESDHEDDEDFEKIYLEEEKVLPYDLALKKYVSSVSDATNNNKPIEEGQKRNLQVTNVDKLKQRQTADEKADATYSFGTDKQENPVKVEVGDYVTYTIRIYNEGLADAKVGEIIDTIPKELTFLPDSSINKKYGWTEFKDESNTGWKEGIKTTILKDVTLPAFDSSKENERKFDSSTGIGIDKGISYAEVKIEFKVNDKAEDSKVITNIAEITKDDGDDNDSTPNNKDPKEDDEDFDKIYPEIKIPPYDLALKKYVSSVSDATNNNKPIEEEQKRNLQVTSVNELKQRQSADEKANATYSFGTDKQANPVEIEIGDYVTYTIRIYNEGLVDAKVGEIIDTIPEELTFLKDSSINKKYGWTEFKDENNTGWKEGIKTTILKDVTLPAFDSSKENEKKFNSSTGIGIDKGISYAEVKIEFKVNDKAEDLKVIKNIAEITKDDGDDNDSTPNNKDPKEDDEDFDVIIPTRFDLSLRKFITQIEENEVKDRVPKVDTTQLDNGTSTTAKYTHPKQEDIKVVVKGQVVIYTIRVYNEGSKDGYASEIKDDLPEGITYLPNHEINKENKWKMYDKEGKETEDVSKAVEIRTDAKSKENGIEKTGQEDNNNPYYKTNTNLIKAYDKEKMTDGPDYVEVKVAFEVTKEVVTDGESVIINTAEITEETDKNGNPVEDDDSVPDNNKLEEDDIDKEYIQLKYFDLSLLKYVTKVIVTEDGVTKETETGYDGTENPEPIVKVELNKKKLDKTEVKYVYTIKITNEGEIEGYAKEVTDRIPDGLAFYEEDNTQYNWKVKEEGIVTTDYLKDKLLKPGESTTVPIVLRWVRSETNLGQKVNVAEISKDENEYGVPDIDSTPNNNKDGEDDQDSAIVVLSINTGSAPLYIVLITTITAILGAGFYLIYKYVIKK